LRSGRDDLLRSRQRGPETVGDTARRILVPSFVPTSFVATTSFVPAPTILALPVLG
jgi:hypothetical protein